MAASGAGWRRYLRFLRPDLRADIRDEMDFHLAMRTRDFELQGHDAPSAREEAERTFGDVTAIGDAVFVIDQRMYRRASRREAFMSFMQDLRLAARSLARSPGLSIVAVLCLAIGIAATASTFTMVRAALIRPLPYRDDDRLASIYVATPDRRESRVNISYHDYYAWRTSNTTFQDIGLWTWSTITISSADEAERVDAALVTANLFPILGVSPILGRQFTPDEEAPGTRVIMLGYGLWQRRFGGDKDIVGKTIRVNAVENTVVGVMPPDFAFPQTGQAWRPQPTDLENDPGNRFYAGAIARLKPGISLAAGAADLENIMRRQEERLPNDYKGWSADVYSMRDDLVGDMRRPLLIFLGAVAMVLLIVCANVANLLLARGTARERELGVRAALGAGRRRIFGHVLLESGILAVVGGALGVLLTPWGLQFFTMAYPRGMPFFLTLRVDGWILAFVVALVGATALLMGVLPSWRATSIDVSTALREGGRSDTRGVRGSRTRNTLVVSELALSVVLLVGAVLLIRSYTALSSIKLGFDTEGLLAVRVALPPAEYTSREKRVAYWDRTYQRLASIPGVEVVGSADGIPFSGWNVMSSMTIEGRPARAPSDELDIHYMGVSPGYLPALGAEIIEGRGITETDRDSVNLVGVINETFARQQFSGESPIGKRVKFGGFDSDWPWMTIVGVVRDFRHWQLPEPMRPAFYWSFMARPSGAQTLVLRTRLENPRSIEPSVRAALRELDPNAPAYGVQTFTEVVSSSFWRQRLQTRVLGVFAVMALVLAALGIYGVISYGVTQRTRELGVRMALGASRREVATMVLGEGGKLAAIGIGIGLVGAFFLRKVVTQLLYDVSPNDPVTFTAVPFVLVAVALAASVIPAMRATRVDPAVAMKAE